MSGRVTFGAPSNELATLARENFPSAGVSGFSLCTTPIELLANDGSDKVISRGTGFFWLHRDRPYLVTCWHVVSGRNSFTKELNADGFEPKRLRFYGVEIRVQNGIVTIGRPGTVLTFPDDLVDRLRAPRNVRGFDVDIITLPIPPTAVIRRDSSRVGFSGSETTSGFINEHQLSKVLSLAGDDVYVLGYPLANYTGFFPPIWKRGSIASDTNIPIDGRPAFLIDAATSGGMSGGPILRKVTTFTADNKDIGALQEFNAYDLIGVYAGRVQDKQLGSINVGYGWFASLIGDVAESMDFLKPDF